VRCLALSSCGSGVSVILLLFKTKPNSLAEPRKMLLDNLLVVQEMIVVALGMKAIQRTQE